MTSAVTPWGGYFPVYRPLVVEYQPTAFKETNMIRGMRKGTKMWKNKEEREKIKKEIKGGNTPIQNRQK
jgi:hypothetical protein